MKKSGIQKHTKNEVVDKPYKLQVATLYAFWLSIPVALKQLSQGQLLSLGYDVSDAQFMSLVECKTKTQFADKFKIQRTRLSVWDKNEKIQEMTEKFNRESNVMRFKKDVDFAFTRKVIKEGDAARMKLWYQIFTDWKEKSETDLIFTREALKEMQDRNRQMFEPKKKPIKVK